MPRYIDVEKADEIIEKELGVYDTTELKEMLSCFPTEDVRVVRHGHWIHGVCGIDKYIKCSLCCKSIVNNIVTLEGDDAETAFVICPRCGAKMDKKEDIDENN